MDSPLARAIAKAFRTKTPIQKTPQHNLRPSAFLASLFAGVSAVKSAYARLQSAQSPYDAAEIQSADRAITSALNKLSGLKRTGVVASPEKTLVQAEIQETNSLLVIYRVMVKNLDSKLKLKDSEITFLNEKLADANNLIENQLLVSANLEMSISLFTGYFYQAVRSTRSFVQLLMREMEFAGWDLELAAGSINQPRINLKSNHLRFAFESFVFRHMFDFSGQKLPPFSEAKSISTPADYLAWMPKSMFAKFCRDKYLRVVHPRMESSIFGNLDQRNSVIGGGYPETCFFGAFCEMAKRVWMVHCLAMSIEASIFQVSRGSRFSEVYMESLNDEVFLESTVDGDVRVAFTVVPGFRVGKTVVQSQVYLQ